MANKKKNIGAAFNELEKPQIDNESPVNNILSEQGKSILDLIPPGFKLVRDEAKSKRVSILITPSLYAEAKKSSAAEGISFNEYCFRAIEAYNKREGKQ